MFKYEVNVKFKIGNKIFEGILLTDQINDVAKNKIEIYEQLKRDGHELAGKELDIVKFEVIKENLPKNKKADFVHYSIEHVKNIEIIDNVNVYCGHLLMRVVSNQFLEQKFVFHNKTENLLKIGETYCSVRKEGENLVFYVDKKTKLHSVMDILIQELGILNKDIIQKSRYLPVYFRESNNELITKIKNEFHNKAIGFELRQEHPLMKEAVLNNILILFGSSDDLMEMRGVFYDEISAYDGFDSNELDKDSEYYSILKSLGLIMNWCPDNQRTWAFSIRSDVDFSTFDIIENNEIFCTGLIVDLNSLKTL